MAKPNKLLSAYAWCLGKKPKASHARQALCHELDSLPRVDVTSQELRAASLDTESLPSWFPLTPSWTAFGLLSCMLRRENWTFPLAAELGGCPPLTLNRDYNRPTSSVTSLWERDCCHCRKSTGCLDSGGKSGHFWATSQKVSLLPRMPPSFRNLPFAGCFWLAPRNTGRAVPVTLPKIWQ